MEQTPFLTLGRWYATPLSPEQAREWLTRIDARENARLRRALECTACRLLRLIARYWLGQSAEEDYAKLARQVAHHHSPRARALLELIYGQLLAARRHPAAMQHLERGFVEARHLLAPADYFVVLKRHSLLKLLPPDGTEVALDLEALLTAARVIERMVGGRRERPSTTPPGFRP